MLLSDSLAECIESYAHAAAAKLRLDRSYIEDLAQDAWVCALESDKTYDPTRTKMTRDHFIRWRVYHYCIKRAVHYKRTSERHARRI